MAGRRGQQEERLGLKQVAKLQGQIQPPFAIVLGSPGSVTALATDLASPDITCYQMDLYHAERLREELGQRLPAENTVTSSDLWDLPARFATVIYPVPRSGERMLKLDMIEQAYHILRPAGLLVVLSPYAADQFFPVALKKIYGKVQSTPYRGGTLFWCRRGENRPRRRHEVTIHARVGGLQLRFLSRPGVFSYGRFDEGARALVETMHVEPGDRILDLGCGSGTNGCFAARRSQTQGLSLPVLADASAAGTVFVDGNVRAVALAALNARANGVASFGTLASHDLAELPRDSFNVILANPPYFAHESIARRFIERGLALLAPGGRYYLVTKQVGSIGERVAETFGEVEMVERRGYTVFSSYR